MYIAHGHILVDHRNKATMSQLGGVSVCMWKAVDEDAPQADDGFESHHIS